MANLQIHEVRHVRSGSLKIPTPRNGVASGFMSPMPAGGRVDGPRSPPNTSHVPCKFFRQGACQAGNACPFNHDLSAASENVCKYFAKGNCKFGPKCANIHVLPDGRRVNYGKNGVTIGVTPINLGSRVPPATYHQQPSNSALTNSFMRGERGDVAGYPGIVPYTNPNDDRYSRQMGRQPSIDNGLPTIDTTYSSNPASAYGSPRDEDATMRYGMGLSPIPKGLSVLDAPLPASFDSNGISHAARYGPWPASVPSKFGFDSPSHSLNAARDVHTTDTIKMLHNSAFGSNEHLNDLGTTGSDFNAQSVGRSPPVTSSSLLSRVGAGEEYYGARPMHSSSSRYTKPRLISHSVPKGGDAVWEPAEEDYVPGELANELLTPDERARRGSNTHTLRGLDEFEIGLGTPQSGGAAGFGRFGSPAAGSPSRFGPLFARQREDELSESLGNGGFGAPGGSTSRSIKHAALSFGHVGSPLRNSSLASGLPSSLRPNASGEVRPGSFSRSGSGFDEGMSALSQQLRRTSVADEGADSHSTRDTAKTGSLGGPGYSAIGRERERDRGLERHVSTGSIGSAWFPTPIDEEDPSILFEMEEEDESNEQARSKKRISGSSPWNYGSIGAGKTGLPGNGGFSMGDNSSMAATQLRR